MFHKPSKIGKRDVKTEYTKTLYNVGTLDTKLVQWYNRSVTSIDPPVGVISNGMG